MLNGKIKYPLPVTNRELEVLQLISIGKTNKYIMDKLAISKYTLKAHIGKLYYKYGITPETINEYSVRRLRLALIYKNELAI